MIAVILKSHFSSACGILGPGDFRSDGALEGRFGAFQEPSPDSRPHWIEDSWIVVTRRPHWIVVLTK